MAATVNKFIDKYHPKANGKCTVSIVVTYERKKKYYKLDYSLTLDEYNTTFKTERFTKNTRYLELIKLGIEDAKKKATDIIKDLPVFTWQSFENKYFDNRRAKETIEGAFTDYADEVRNEGRIGTAVSYECARESIKKFSEEKKYNELKFADVTPSLLKEYETWMLKQGRSKATIGIYLRPLRALFNTAITNGDLKKDHYPFGLEKNRRYEIPTGKNIKKALQLSDIKLIFNHKPETEPAQRAKDFWVFMYLCNGINVKDMCLLTYGNIEGDVMKFVRAKTKRTKKNANEIRVALTDDAKEIIKKWGNKKKDADTYIFPLLQKGLTAERERQLIQQITQVINSHMKAIANDLNIDSKSTTYVSRHSFATVLLRHTKNLLLVGNALGHSDIKTTQNYFAGFEDATLKDAMAALTAFDID
jgi:site-specific recombinase XerD